MSEWKGVFPAVTTKMTQEGKIDAAAMQSSLDRLVRNATAMGANAVLVMRFDSSEIGQTMSEIVAYGTAAVIEREAG